MRGEIRREVRRACHRESLLTTLPRDSTTTYEIGAPGFEPGTFWSQTRRATGLRYAPLALRVSNLTRLALPSNGVMCSAPPLCGRVRCTNPYTTLSSRGSKWLASFG